MTAPELSDYERGVVARFDAAEPVAESFRDRVAIALWQSDVQGVAGAEHVAPLWGKVCAHFPDDAAAYRRLADAAIAVIKAAQ